MKKLIFIFIGVLILLFLFAEGALLNLKSKLQVSPMTITSSSFQPNATIPNDFTCKGNKLSPILMFHNVPRSAQSLVVIIEDPDAPNGTLVHWLVYNIPSNISEISADTLPPYTGQGLNSLGQPTYFAPCPTIGTHHYHFKLYALDKNLDLLGNPNYVVIRNIMQGHIISQADLVGLISSN